MRKRKILFVTGIRSEFYIQRPVMQAVKEHKGLRCQVVVTGAHLSKKFGYTVKEARKERFNIVAEIDNLILSDDPASRVKGAAKQLDKLIDVFKQVKPDIVVAPFDREEAMTVALAGVYMNIPVAHLGAGDKTDTNVDGIVRHSVSKLAHILFTATKENADRLIRMGEERRRVYFVGHSGLDRYRNISKMTRKEIAGHFGLDLSGRPLLVMLQHPVSHEINKAEKQIRATLKAVDKLNYPTVIIYPNSDPGRNKMVDLIKKFRYKNTSIRLRTNIEEKIFINLMRHTDVLVGNSSMGILEAPLLKIPVVNVGNRQRGRQRADNVVFVGHDEKEIVRAVKKCLTNAAFKERMKRCKSPYGSGHSGKRIAQVLFRIEINERLLNKQVTY